MVFVVGHGLAAPPSLIIEQNNFFNSFNYSETSIDSRARERAMRRAGVAAEAKHSYCHGATSESQSYFDRPGHL